MKLLFAVHGYPPESTGGTELYVRKLAEALVARGHQVSVVAGSLQWFHQDRVSEDVVEGVRVSRIHRSDPYNDRWDKSFAPTVGALFEPILQKAKPDLVHVHHWLRLSRDLVELARRRRVPAVVTLHDLWSTCLKLDRVLDGEAFCERKLDPAACVPCVGGARPWTGPGELREAAALFREDLRHELLLARRRIVPTAGHGARIAAALDLDPQLFTVIPNGSITDLAPAARREPMADGKLRIGHWGALYEAKGAHVLLEAVRAMRHRARVQVVLYGATSDDAYGEKLRRLAEGIDVSFLGMFRAPDLARAVFDVVVLPSLAAESYSFALDEAAALGFPIVASDFGALGERLGDGGLRFPRGDRAALAAILDGLVEEPARLSQLSGGPRALTIDEHAARLEALYAEAKKEGPPPRTSEFSDRAHALFEFKRSENRHRHALRYESLARFSREVQEDRDNRIKMIDFLQAERERLERANAEMARRLAEAEHQLSQAKARAAAAAPAPAPSAAPAAQGPPATTTPTTP